MPQNVLKIAQQSHMPTRLEGKEASVPALTILMLSSGLMGDLVLNGEMYDGLYEDCTRID